MPYIDVEPQRKLYYEIYGEGKPLVLVSGYSANSAAWILAVQTLSKHFKCVVFDNRDAGLSDPGKGDYSVLDMAQDTILLIRALKLEKPHIYGNSLGGAVVQAMAYHYPNEIDRVIIGNSSAKFNEQIIFSVQTFLEIYAHSPEPVLDLAKLWLPFCFSSKFIENRANVEACLEMSVHNPKPMTLEGMRAQFKALKTFDARGWVKDIRNPCLILSADEDLICLPKEIHYLHEEIPDSKLHVFENCGHLPHIERPAINNEVVLAFLSKTADR